MKKVKIGSGELAKIDPFKNAIIKTTKIYTKYWTKCCTAQIYQNDTWAMEIVDQEKPHRNLLDEGVEPNIQPQSTWDNGDNCGIITVDLIHLKIAFGIQSEATLKTHNFLSFWNPDLWVLSHAI